MTWKSACKQHCGSQSIIKVHGGHRPGCFATMLFMASTTRSSSWKTLSPPFNRQCSKAMTVSAAGHPCQQFSIADMDTTDTHTSRVTSEPGLRKAA